MNNVMKYDTCHNPNFCSSTITVSFMLFSH